MALNCNFVKLLIGVRAKVLLDPTDLKAYTLKSMTELSFVKVSEDLKNYRSAFFHADFGLLFETFT